MKRTSGTVCALCLTLLVTAFTVIPALAADQAGDLDTLRKGRQAFDAQCMKCHRTVDEAGGGKRQRGTWDEIVTAMITEGAELDEGQKAAVIDYLTRRSLFITKCGVCHSIQRPLVKNKSREDWKATVTRMSGKFANHISPEEIELLSDFLVVERPPL